MSKLIKSLKNPKVLKVLATLGTLGIQLAANLVSKHQQEQEIERVVKKVLGTKTGGNV
jgi:hypothetical protein